MGLWQECNETDLEHLDIRNAQVQICGVAEDETAAEEEANRKNRAYEHVFRHVNVLSSI